MSAVRMRATGHNQEAVVAALHVHAKAGRGEESRNWSSRVPSARRALRVILLSAVGL